MNLSSLLLRKLDDNWLVYGAVVQIRCGAVNKRDLLPGLLVYFLDAPIGFVNVAKEVIKRLYLLHSFQQAHVASMDIRCCHIAALKGRAVCDHKVRVWVDLLPKLLRLVMPDGESPVVEL